MSQMLSVPGWKIEEGEPDPTTGLRLLTLECQVEGCTHLEYTGVRGDLDKFLVRSLRGHQEQHKPGRALDIAVDWEVSALCSVCEDGVGDIVREDEGVTCRECGTSWDLDGTDGRRDEER